MKTITSFFRCRLVAHDFKHRDESPREDLYGAMRPLETRKALFAYFAGTRRAGRYREENEVKLVFVGVNRGVPQPPCDEEAWVDSPAVFQTVWKIRWDNHGWLCGMCKAASRWEDGYAREFVSDGCRRGRAASTMLYHPVGGRKK